MAAPLSTVPVIAQANSLKTIINEVRAEARNVESTLASANIATVMGSAINAGENSEEQVRDFIGGDATIQSLLHDNENAAAILSRLGQLGVDMNRDVAQAVSQQA